MVATKRSTVFVVERTDWFGDCERVDNFHTRAEAEAFAVKCRRSSDACDDKADKVRYAVTEETWEREA